MDSYHGLLLSIPSLSLSDESDELVCCLRSSSERDRIILYRNHHYQIWETLPHIAVWNFWTTT